MKNNNIIINNTNIQRDTHHIVDTFINEINRFIQRFIIANNYDTTDSLVLTFNDVSLLLKRTLNAYHALITSFNDTSFLIETHFNFMNRLFKKGLTLTIPVNDSKSTIKPLSSNSKQRTTNNDTKKRETAAERYKKENSYHVKYQKNLNKKMHLNNNNNSNCSNNSINISNISCSNILTNSICSKDLNSIVLSNTKHKEQFISTFKPANRSGGLISTIGQMNQQQQQQLQQQQVVKRKKCKSLSRNEKTKISGLTEHIGDGDVKKVKVRNGSVDDMISRGNGGKRRFVGVGAHKIECLWNLTGKNKDNKKIDGDIYSKDVIFTCVNSKPTKIAQSILEKGYDILQQFKRNNSSKDERHNRCKSVY